MRDVSRPSIPSDGATAPQEFGWRSTPKINFAPERRSIPFSPVIALLAVVLLIGALGALTVYGWLQDAEAESLAASGRLEAVQRALAQERAATDDVAVKTGAIDEEIKQVERQSAGVIEVYNRLTQKRPNWTVAAQALLRADSETFRIYSLEANPPSTVDVPAQINLSATAAGTDTIGAFLNHMAGVDDFLELASWNTALTSSNRTVLEAVVNLK